jgi:hypothetical protein
LQYIGGRWYDPAVGGYIQPDPMGGVPQAPQTLNRYAAWSGVVDGDTHEDALALNLEPLLRFGLNKALISTAKGFPPGLMELAWKKAAWRHIDKLPDYLYFNRRFIGRVNPDGTEAIIPLLALSRKRSVEVSSNYYVGMNVLYKRELKVSFARSFLKQAPLFAADAFLNGYFQYQDEAYLPEDLRWKRAAAGGAGNAVVSTIVSGLGTLAFGALCVETAGLACAVAVGSATLGADILANSAFDAWGKEWVLERFNIGLKQYDKLEF